MKGGFWLSRLSRGFTKLNFTSDDFDEGELLPDIPLNVVDRHVGRRIRNRRTYLKMSEEHLANAIGVSAVDIWAFEEGKSRIGFAALQAVGSALRVSERYFYREFGAQTA